MDTAESQSKPGIPATDGRDEGDPIAVDQRATDFQPAERGEGSHTLEFFASLTTGQDGAPNLGAPFIPLHDLDGHGNFVACYESFRSSFDRHIATNIPGYYELQIYKGDAIRRLFSGRSQRLLLDIGCSEGSFLKTLCALSPTELEAVGVEPNPAMWETFYRLPQTPNAKCVLSAFGYRENEGAAWMRVPIKNPAQFQASGYKVDDKGVEIGFFSDQRRFSIVHESETFQFISDDRASQVARCKEYLTADGIVFFEEKFLTERAEYVENEFKKDTEYKSRFFTEEYIIKKTAQIQSDGLLKMTAGQIHWRDMETILRKNFRFVFRYWKSGNFRGYAASDHFSNLRDFIDALSVSENEFSEIRPQIIR